MTGRAAFRGQPLLLIGGVLAGWMALRVATWEPPFETVVAEPLLAPPVAPASVGAVPPALTARERSSEGIPVPYAGPRDVGPAGSFAQPPMPSPLWAVPPLPPPVLLEDFAHIPPEAPLDPPRAAIGHNLMLALGLSQMPLPAAFAAYLRGPAAPSGRAAAGPSPTPVPSRQAPAFSSRWSADGWLLLRRDGGQGALLSGRPGYGRSQAGAVVRYALAPLSPHRPQAHLRGAAALAGAREREAAAGVSLRPLPGVPLRLAGEARFSETATGSRVRPAAYAVTEFPRLDLPMGFRGEAYAQAGYVSGDFASAFADVQVRAERPLARVGATEVSAGAGAWGGAQRDAARLDIGPTAAVTFRLGEAHGRVSADYRFRVAGDAEPESGPALTLSAGF